MNQIRANVTRIPRRRLKANTGGNETTFSSRYVSQTAGTGASLQAWGYVFVAPSLHASNDDPGTTIARYHQEYVVNKATCMYTPAVGTTTAGTIWMAYFDNPEMIYKFASGSYGYSDYLLLARSAPNAKSAQVWQPLEISATVPPRRKMFTIDQTPPASAEVADRTVQGVFIYATSNAPASTTLGFISDSYTTKVRGLQLQSVALI